MILSSFEVLFFVIPPILLISDFTTLAGLFMAECIFHSTLLSIFLFLFRIQVVMHLWGLDLSLERL